MTEPAVEKIQNFNVELESDEVDNYLEGGDEITALNDELSNALSACIKGRTTVTVTITITKSEEPEDDEDEEDE